jgi:hypothetical protein
MEQDFYDLEGCREGTAVINVVVLQNTMDLVKGELGSYSKKSVTCTVDGYEVIGKGAERVTDTKEEEDQEATTIPVIKTEPKVTCVPVVSTFHIGYIQNFLSLIKTIDSVE